MRTTLRYAADRGFCRVTKWSGRRGRERRDGEKRTAHVAPTPAPPARTRHPRGERGRPQRSGTTLDLSTTDLQMSGIGKNEWNFDCAWRRPFGAQLHTQLLPRSCAAPNHHSEKNEECPKSNLAHFLLVPHPESELKCVFMLICPPPCPAWSVEQYAPPPSSTSFSQRRGGSVPRPSLLLGQIVKL